MHKTAKRGLAVILAAVLSIGALAGCSRKDKNAFDAAKDMLSLADGAAISAGTANLYLRYRQAEFENGIGAFLKSYYGNDIWNYDMYGYGEIYANTFKQQILDDMQKMLLDEKHAADYGVELTDAEKTAIKEAADAFIKANGEEVLEKMNATPETAERMLTLLTIRDKVEDGMTKDVNREVSDEEAAQRTVRYAQFTARVEEETEAVTEAETGDLGDALEAASEAVAEAVAAVEAESEVKTGSADEAVSEAVSESVAEAATEAEEVETESPEMMAARVVAIDRAAKFLNEALKADDFKELADAASEEDSTIYTSTYTFGESDSYPDAAIIEATKGLEDGTVVDHVVEVGDSYYVLCVEDAFDEDATEQEKKNIIRQRENEAINAVYDEWLASEDEKFTLDNEQWTSLIFDIALAYEAEPSTEAATEGAPEEISESVAEQVTE